MSTNASITLKTKEGTFKSITLHWDGYPSYAGKILLEHYNTYDKVEGLINLGDLSVISESIECPDGHSFDTQVKGYCVAYGRDRGDDGTKAGEYMSYNDALIWYDMEYNYLFQDGKWYVEREELTMEIVKEDE